MSLSASSLARSLLVKRQRALLDGIGAAVGTDVIYLKAAWADPVLYDGRGERSGVDIDVLVAPSSYEAYAARLVAEGFTKRPLLRHHAIRGHSFAAPAGLIDVDLHRSIAQPPWFTLDEAALRARAHLYDSVDGPIRGLAPNDQVVHAVAHYTAARFTLDERHLNDVVRLLKRFDVDWDAIDATCNEGHLDVGLRLLLRMLPDAPILPTSASTRLRLQALQAFFDAQGERRHWTRNAVANTRIDLLTYMPLVSSRLSALPRFLGQAALARVFKNRGS